MLKSKKTNTINEENIVLVPNVYWKRTDVIVLSSSQDIGPDNSWSVE